MFPRGFSWPFRLISVLSTKNCRGVTRGRPGRGMPSILNRRLSGFLREKLALWGRSCLQFFLYQKCTVLWASDMPKVRWRPRLHPGPHWGCSQPSQTPSRLGRGHPSLTPLPQHSVMRLGLLVEGAVGNTSASVTATFRRLDYRTFCVQLLWLPV